MNVFVVVVVVVFLKDRRRFTQFLDAIFLYEDPIRLFCSFVDVLEVFVENWRYHFVICD